MQLVVGSNIMVTSRVCTLVNMPVGTQKTAQCKLQVMPTTSASEVIALAMLQKDQGCHPLHGLCVQATVFYWMAAVCWLCRQSEIHL